jgi:hypothetical protein
MWSKKDDAVSIARERLDVGVLFLRDSDNIVIHVTVDLDRVTIGFFLALFTQNGLGMATVISLQMSRMSWT